MTLWNGLFRMLLLLPILIIGGFWIAVVLGLLRALWKSGTRLGK